MTRRHIDQQRLRPPQSGASGGPTRKYRRQAPHNIEVPLRALLLGSRTVDLHQGRKQEIERQEKEGSAIFEEANLRPMSFL
jgi:hypothetical protein